MKTQLTMENGKRWSTDKILYQKARDTLTILTYAHANKVRLSLKIIICYYICTIYHLEAIAFFSTKEK